jgi:glycosyltransferase involved in cell wall biosynthesis
MPNIYYLIPDLSKPRFSSKALVKSLVTFTLFKYLKSAFIRKEKPIGGIKVIYQHCILLRELGYSAYPLLMGKYRGNFFGFNLDYKTKKQVIKNLQKDDVVVATEFLPYQGLIFEGATKVLFMQNWINIRTRLNNSDIDRSYIDLGYDEVITCGEYCSKLVLEQMGIMAKTITNGIDQDKFQSNPHKRIINRVLALSRKNHDDLLEVINLTNHIPYELIVVDDLTEEQLIDEYQKADIFLAMGYPEGFGLPPLEAMSCGCVVVGFTGGGASEFMINGITALVSDDGDCKSVAKDMEYILHDPDYKDRLRAAGQEISKQYSLENTKSSLLEFYKYTLNINPNDKLG